MDDTHGMKALRRDVVRRFAIEAQGVPIVLYNPPHAKTQVSTRLLGELAQHGAVRHVDLRHEQVRARDRQRDGAVDPDVEHFIAGLKAIPDMPLVNCLNDAGKAIPAYKPIAAK